MLVVFFGTDVVGVRTKAHEYIHAHSAPDTATIFIDQNTYQSQIVVDAAASSSLFTAEQVYVLDTPSEDEDFFLEVVDNLPALHDSHNVFVVIEGPLKAAEKKKYEKYASQSVEVQGEAAERTNTFALADAIANRDKKAAWILLYDARQTGMRDEEIIGIMWWQLKTLRLAALTQHHDEAGIKEYPYKKAKRALKNFKPGDVERLSASLLALYHDAHAGERDLGGALEQWVLTH